MIHESSKWLSENIGYSIEYWDKLKRSLNKKFCRPDPITTQTKFSKHIRDKAIAAGFIFDPSAPHEPPKKNQYIGNIPSLKDNFDDYPTEEAKQLYNFPTQFNAYGQRTNSGVSIVDWDKVHLRCNRLVKELVMEGKSCTQVKVKNNLTKKNEVYTLKKHGKVILAAGSQSPRLLMRTPIENKYIGKRVNDHICLPLGLYIVSKDLKARIGGADVYEPIFGSTLVTSNCGQNDAGVKGVVFLDFFTGSLENLSFMVSSLYLCFVPFNCLKRLFGRYPILFTFLSNSIRILLTVLVFVVDVLTFKFLNESNELKLTTSLIKFKAVREGHYEKENDQITLRFFEDENDFVIAEKAIKENLAFLESIGSRPNILIRKLFQLLTKIPYDEDEVERYVKNFSKRTLLSEQHLAGGCVFGEAIDKGLNCASDTGKVFGTDNIHVADLSAVPLPRCSTQMTAYLVGYHVGKQMFH
ncbi:choline dehydrogenase [Chaetoceros tenuissimus]|uniref:Choline dehydrogenase n=1 Tax=Chaetoceros tenuissimus TaxID=426638 RepID=A0AAD3CZD2_9STRA|nr:choline dehydrogenase [Chaetoceros tenuissimus]